jgi:hypothetical protein
MQGDIQRLRPVARAEGMDNPRERPEGVRIPLGALPAPARVSSSVLAHPSRWSSRPPRMSGEGDSGGASEGE